MEKVLSHLNSVTACLTWSVFIPLQCHTSGEYLGGEQILKFNLGKMFHRCRTESFLNFSWINVQNYVFFSDNSVMGKFALANND